MKKEVIVYRNGIVHCSVCTNFKQRKRITDAVNAQNPTGIGSKWVISNNKTFSSGELNPCPCDQHPETHRHYLMEC